ncbi:hypothetical protein O3G_MSEX006201 [Manduca sexta]|uniref:Reverse transcriptase domain-containing protein n=1 Tax=Manduca sexta TaxID=7130 RepID=A0A921Z1G2_MANSE|nr:hypothetical protein O3G_MSEX006201 [Manduca sexta]
MTKAYDKVQFKILLNKLHGIGIRGKSHDWFKSYLQNRSQIVEIDNYNHATNEIQKIFSLSKNIHASIPQGSVIGCLLFLIYINDLPKILDWPCVLFADDISLLTSCKSHTNLNEKICNILSKTENWMTSHNLQLNYQKTKLITFHPPQKQPLNIDISYKGTTLELVKNVTLLGLDIDSHINWKQHIQKISKFTYALYEIKKTTDVKTALSSYYAYAYSWLSYGVILWGNSTDAQILFTLQKN